MELIDDFIEKEEFESDRHCEFCNSQEGKVRMVGNYVVELSTVDVEEDEKLACQGCRIKYRNLSKAEKAQQQNRSFLKKLF